MRRNKSFRDATYADMKLQVQRWLKNCGDRCGARKKRQATAIKKQTDELVEQLQETILDKERTIQKLQRENLERAANAVPDHDDHDDDTVTEAS